MDFLCMNFGIYHLLSGALDFFLCSNGSIGIASRRPRLHFRFSGFKINAIWRKNTIFTTCSQHQWKDFTSKKEQENLSIHKLIENARRYLFHYCCHQNLLPLVNAGASSNDQDNQYSKPLPHAQIRGTGTVCNNGLLSDWRNRYEKERKFRTCVQEFLRIPNFFFDCSASGYL